MKRSTLDLIKSIRSLAITTLTNIDGWKKKVSELKAELDETRSHLFTILAEQNHPFKFKPGQTVGVGRQDNFRGLGWVISERWHQKDGPKLTDCTNAYKLYRTDSEVVLEELEDDLYEYQSPAAPAKRKHTKSKSKKS